MTPATERTLKTLAYSWIAGALAGAFLGWLLVPAALSVEYLTPIVVTGSFACLIAAAGVLANRRRAAETDRAGDCVEVDPSSCTAVPPSRFAAAHTA